MLRTSAAAGLAAGLLPVTAAPSPAATYCVGSPPGCTGITPAPNTIAQAISDATAPGVVEDDTIVIGTGTFPATQVQVPSNADGELVIEGQGRGNTTLTRTTAEAEPRLDDADAVLAGVRIEIPASASFSRALTLYGATAEDVEIFGYAGSPENTGVVMGEGAVLADSSVSLYGAAGIAVQSFPSGDARVVRSALAACYGVLGNATGTMTAEHVRVTSLTPFWSRFGSLLVDGSVGRIAAVWSDCTNAPWGVAVTDAFSPGRSVEVHHTTIVGADQPSSRGVRLRRDSGSAPVAAIARSSVFTGVEQTIESTGAPLPTMTFSASAFDAAATTEPGFGTGTFPNVADPVLGFADQAAGDYRLTVGSGLIDRGEHPLPAGRSDEDLEGEDRRVDGKANVNGTDARPDIGADEFDPNLPLVAVVASAASAPIGVPIEFTMVGDSGDPSAAPAFSWRFDDGTTATGFETSKAFATPGPHRVTGTLVNASGFAAERTVTVTITAPGSATPPSTTSTPPSAPPRVVPPPRRPATPRVSFVRRTSTVDRRGRAPIGLRCAGARCTGTLTLRVDRRVRGRRRAVVVGRARFAIAAGRTATPRVTLARSVRRAMRRARRFTVRAEAAVTGGRAARATLVVRPRR